jgi:hypothetical protein
MHDWGYKMKLEDAGKLNLGVMTLEEIEKKYWNNWVVLVNLLEQKSPSKVLGGEVYFVSENRLDALDAEYNAHDKGGYTATYHAFVGEDDPRLKAAIL